MTRNMAESGAVVLVHPEDGAVESALRGSRAESTRGPVHTVSFRITGSTLADV